MENSRNNSLCVGTGWGTVLEIEPRTFAQSYIPIPFFFVVIILRQGLTKSPN